MKFYLSSKIHKATVTQADINYIGSITIDKRLCEKVGLEAGEKVLVVSNTYGARLETYVIKTDEIGMICMNGAAAHLIKEKEEIIIMGFSLSDKPIKPKQILVDENNEFKEYL